MKNAANREALNIWVKLFLLKKPADGSILSCPHLTEMIFLALIDCNS